jgi:uncharacterized protein involved in exopolysaccharide biosynthesis
VRVWRPPLSPFVESPLALVTDASPPQSADVPSSAAQEVVSLLSIVNMVLRNRYLVGGAVLLATLLVVLTVVLLPRKYTAESSFMLQSRPNLPANLAGLASQFGVALPTGDANQSPAFYGELLQSREILTAVVDTPIGLHEGAVVRQAPLAEWLKVRASTSALQREKTIRKLRKAVDASVSVKTGVVTLHVTTRNAELSLRISERMLSWLNDFNLEKRQSQASAERKFTEARLEEARQQLREAEDRLLVFTQRNRDTRSSPLLSLEQDRLSREVMMRQQVYTSLVQAYDRAKIEEVRDTPVITILEAPEQPVRADPLYIVIKLILTIIVALILGIWLAMGREALLPRPPTNAAPQAEFALLRAAVRDDLRHPRRTLGRLLRLGWGSAVTATEWGQTDAA